MTHTAFKKAAREYQIKYRKETIKDIDGNKYPTWLSDVYAKKGKNFFDGFGIFDAAQKYRKIYFSYPLNRGRINLYSDMLRSEHIPFNLFVPLKKDLEFCKRVFNKILGGNIASIDKNIVINNTITENIIIEYAPSPKENYLNDRTSFDTYIEYTHTDNSKGIICIEVKYTEKEYPLVKFEKDKITLTKSYQDVEDFKNQKGIYYNTTKACKLYKEECLMDLVGNKFRQIWRNHLLAESILIENEKNNQIGDKDKIKHAHSLIFHPEGNEHFKEVGEKYKEEMLADNKKDTFGLVTFEKFIEICKNCNPDNEFQNRGSDKNNSKKSVIFANTNKQQQYGKQHAKKHRNLA